MLKIRQILVVSVAAVLSIASVAQAHHIAGKVYCDVNYNGVIDVGTDTPLSGILAKVTSLDVAPGLTWFDSTSSTGFYRIDLPARTDLYRDELVNLPVGWSVVLPVGGTYTIQIITQTTQDHDDNANFLIQGCAPPPTTTTTTAPTTTTSTSAPVTTTTSTTAAPTTTTTTTTVPLCLDDAECDDGDPCNGREVCNPQLGCLPGGPPFSVARLAKINNLAQVFRSFGVNNPPALTGRARRDGRIRTGQDIFFADGTTVIAQRIDIGNGSSVFNVLAEELRTGRAGVFIRGSIGTPTLPITAPYCVVPAVTCGGPDVRVRSSEALLNLPPGSYGRLRVLNKAMLTLAPGDFTFCDVKTGQGVTLLATGASTIGVENNVILGNDSVLGPDVGAPTPVLNVTGKKVRVGTRSIMTAIVSAPNALVSMGRDSVFHGAFCADKMKSDKRITLDCP
jgi:hypothetical protein